MGDSCKIPALAKIAASLAQVREQDKWADTVNEETDKHEQSFDGKKASRSSAI